VITVADPGIFEVFTIAICYSMSDNFTIAKYFDGYSFSWI